MDPILTPFIVSMLCVGVAAIYRKWRNSRDAKRQDKQDRDNWDTGQ